MKNVELVPHLEQFIFAEHIEFTILLHEDPQFVTICKYLIVIIGLDADNFFIEQVHEHFTT